MVGDDDIAVIGETELVAVAGSRLATGGVGGADTSIGAPSGGNGAWLCNSADPARGAVAATLIGWCGTDAGPLDVLSLGAAPILAAGVAVCATGAASVGADRAAALLAGAAGAGSSAGAVGASAVGFSSGAGRESELGNVIALLGGGGRILLVAAVLPTGRGCGGDKYTGIDESSPAVVA